MNYPTAYFVSLPHQIEDLKRMHDANRRKPYVIVKTVELARIDYENFVTDMCVYRKYIEESAGQCRIDDGIWHCLYIRQIGAPEGVLVMPDNRGFAEWAAYLPEESGK